MTHFDVIGQFTHVDIQGIFGILVEDLRFPSFLMVGMHRIVV
jgi:hypothetical protein